MRLTSNRKGPFDSKSVLLRETGFIDIKALAESARITGSKEEKIMLATGDQAYVGFTKDRPLRPASATRCSWPTPRTRCAPPRRARSSATWCASTATS